MTQDGQQVENVLHFEGPDTYDAATLESLGLLVLDSWQANMLPLQTADLSLREIYLTDISSASGPVATVNAGLPDPGTGTGLGVPTNVTLAISLRSALRGRSYRGRVYPCGMLQPKVVNSLWDATYAAAWVAAFAQLKTDAAAEGHILSVLSLRANNAPRTTGVLTTVTNVTLVDLVADSQRRRLPTRGA